MKGPDAFRTISEVAEALDVPQHVLRFWETRFSQVRPMKRGGGRRYYRPEDVALLKGIRTLLYGEGFTIKGVQRILRERGVQHVIAVAAGEVSGDGVPVARVVQFKPASGGAIPAGAARATSSDEMEAGDDNGHDVQAATQAPAGDEDEVPTQPDPQSIDGLEAVASEASVIDPQVVRSALHELTALKSMLDQAREGESST